MAVGQEPAATVVAGRASAESGSAAATLEAILGCVADGVLVYDRDGRIVRSNAAADALFGYASSERQTPLVERVATGRHEWFAEDGRRLAPEELPALRAARYGETHRDVVLRQRSAEEERWIRVSAAPLLVGGERVGAVASVSDITDRKRAEEALRDALAKAEDRGRLLDAVMDHIPMGLTIADAPDVSIRAVSRYGRELVGKSSEELTGIPAGRHPESWQVYPADGVTFAAADELPLTRATLTGEVVRGEEWVVTRKDGVKIPILCTAAPIRDGQGRITGGVIGWQDLTQRERSEEALRVAEERARARATELEVVLDTVPAAVWIAHDREGSRIGANRLGTEMLRLPARTNVSVTAPAGERPTRFRPMKNGAELGPDELPIQAAAKFGTEFHDYEFDLVFDDGTVRHLLGNSSPLRDASGAPRGSVGAFIDITDRKRAEKRAEALARFPEENPDPVLRLDRSSTVVYANDAARDRLRPLRVEPGAVAPAELAAPALRATRERRRIKAEISCGDAVFSLSVVPVEDEVNVYAQDVTARKRAEEALVDANRRKDEFLSAASHELRTPLTTVILHAQGLARMLSGGPLDEGRVRRKLTSMDGQLERLSRLVGTLLDVTRISGGRLHLERQHCDLAQLAGDAVERFEDVAERTGSTFVLDASPAPGVWDRLRIEQVLTNVLDNAMKYAPGSAVHVRVAARPGEAVLAVRDSGPGISPESQARIFQQYERAAEAHVFGGLGLGLWITRQIVEAHGGTISVESAPGAGSTFTVRLPTDRS